MNAPFLETLLDAERRAPGAPRAVREALGQRLAGIVAAPQAVAVPAAGLAVSKAILLSLATFTLGVGAGAGWTRARTPEPPAPPVAPMRPVVPDMPQEPPAVEAIIPTPPPRAARVRQEPPVAGFSEQAERALLEQARTALASGDMARAEQALVTLDRSARGGRLQEERAVLAIELLVRQGRMSEARQAGERFRLRFPSSLYLEGLPP